MKKYFVSMMAAGFLALGVLAGCSTSGLEDEIMGALVDSAPNQVAEPNPIYEAGADDILEGLDAGLGGGMLELTPEDLDMLWGNMIDPDTVEVIIDGQNIDTPTPFVDSSAGAIMLPLVSIAEALGYSVVDNGGEVIVGPGSIVTEGVNSFSRGREAARELSTAPVMVDGTMFVPWEFFQEILSHSAFMDEGNIVLAAIDY